MVFQSMDADDSGSIDVKEFLNVRVASLAASILLKCAVKSYDLEQCGVASQCGQKTMQRTTTRCKSGDNA